MKLVKSKVELIQQGEGLDGLYRHIETCGRVPYKSYDKSDDTVEGAKAFVDRMVKSNHLAVLEHGTVYLKKPAEFSDNENFKYNHNPYSRSIEIGYKELGDNYIAEGTYFLITTNLRVLQENGWLDDLQYICEPTELHEKRYTFKVNTSIGVTREINRHRSLSILESSTRYCNFSKDKFDNQVSFCKPSWVNLNYGNYELKDFNMIGDGYLVNILDSTEIVPENQFLFSCLRAEENYMDLLHSDWKPQQAREVLPLCTATEAVYTGFAEEWAHFFNLRYFESTGKVHPNMLELSTKMKEEAEKASIWAIIYKYIKEENNGREE